MTPSIKCPHCGKPNPVTAPECRACGKPLTHGHTIVGGVPVCISCGAKVESASETCNSCGMPVKDLIRSNLPENLHPEECVHWSEKPASAGRSAKVSVAGILILLAGFMGVFQAFFALTPEIGEGFLQTYESAIPWAESTDEVVAEYVLLQIAVFVFGAVAIFGSMFALNGSRFDYAMVGAVSGILAIGLLLGAFLSLVALILVATSRKTFLSEC